MRRHAHEARLLIAEDDPGDQLLLSEAIDAVDRPKRVDFVEDGIALLDYLRSRGRFAESAGRPLPSLILLDLNMPRMDGIEALSELRADRALRHIPVVVLSTSAAPSDVEKCHDLGANAYMVKPDSYRELTQVVEAIADYWLDAVELPPH